LRLHWTAYSDRRDSVVSERAAFGEGVKQSRERLWLDAIPDLDGVGLRVAKLRRLIAKDDAARRRLANMTRVILDVLVRGDEPPGVREVQQVYAAAASPPRFTIDEAVEAYRLDMLARKVWIFTDAEIERRCTDLRRAMEAKHG
jgi:hypothetical protein